MMQTCYLFGAGEYGALTLSPAELSGGLVIAADGGYAWLQSHGVTPHLAVGDFDSLGRVPEDVEAVRHPCEKDDTDMMLAVREGLDRGCRRFLIYGGLGGRLDHTLANLHLLDFLAGQGCQGFLLGENSALTAVRNGGLAFGPEHTGTLSLFCWGGPAEGVTLTGLRYTLDNGALVPDRPLGVSNEFLGREALVQVNEGTLLALWNQPELLPRLL